MAANNIYIQVDFNSQNAQQNVNALNTAIANTGPVAAKTSQQASQSFASVGVSISQVNREFAAMSSAIAGLGIAKFAMEMMHLAAEMSRAEKAQAALATSAAEAEHVFDQIRAIADKSPFKFDDLEKAGQSMMALGFAAKNVPYALKAITDQVTRMSGTIGDVNTITSLFGRIMQKDFVAAMDLLRALPAQGVPVIRALGAEIQKQKGILLDSAGVKEAIKDGILDPMQTIRVMLEAMTSKGDTEKFTDDAARAFKNLRDTVVETISKLFGPEGFGPALKNLGERIAAIGAVIGGFIDWLMKLSPHTKQIIVNVAAAAAAFAAFGTAMGVITSLAGPLMNFTEVLAKFGWTLLTINPTITLTTIAVGALAYVLYKLVPAVKNFVDSKIGGGLDMLKEKMMGLAEAGKQFMAKALEPGVGLETDNIVRENSEKFQKLLEAQQKVADAGQKALLEALSTPVEAVHMKYVTLFRELEKEIKLLPETEQATLRGLLTTAEVAEKAGAAYKETKRERDEMTRAEVEHAKNATEAQVAYIEAQNTQDLRGRIAAIDQITQMRIDGANEVGEIETRNLQKQFQSFEKLANAYRDEWTAAGIDVDAAILAQHQEMMRKQEALERKAADDAQNYRLAGWKKANDAIIEDQKRVYDAFKDQFSQLFDVFTDRTKSLGAALGDFFKKMVVGEARQLFSSAMGAAATQAAGYGQPQEGITRGGEGILGILMRRGMPPRPPMPPPQSEAIGAATSELTPLASTASSMEQGANRFEISTDAYSVATLRFAEAVQDFADGARVSSTGSADREMPAGFGSADRTMGPTTVSQAFANASQRTGVPEALLRAVAQRESSMNPMAVSNRKAAGLMQLMPGTARDLGVTNVFDVEQNVQGGAEYLRQLLRKYNGDTRLALAAYNWGPGNLDRSLRRGGQWPQETRDYVSNIMRNYSPGVQAPPVPAPAPMMMGPTFEELANLPTTRQPMGVLQTGVPEYRDDMPYFSTTVWGRQDVEPVLTALRPFMRAGGGSTGGGVLGAVASAASTPSAWAGLKKFFGLGPQAEYVRGETPGPESLARAAGFLGFGSKLKSVLTSQAAGMAATLGGMALVSKGFGRYAPVTVAGGGLAGAGMVLSSPQLMARFAKMPGGAGLGIAAGVATGAGLGLFASGFQRGGAAGLGMSIGGGALAGAGIGTMIAPGIGTLIGAGIGAAVGGISGVVRLFVHTQAEKIRKGIKQVYGIDITNTEIIKQIQQIVDQTYGGNVDIGIRSQEVQDLVRLYALTTGQAAGLPRPMYNATIAQSQAGGLAMQPIYQGGMQVRNPYTGPTTYQYQTAVTAAQGLAQGTGSASMFIQLNPQQANDLFTGRVVQAVQQNPAAVASANASAARSGDSRASQASTFLEPLTSLG